MENTFFCSESTASTVTNPTPPFSFQANFYDNYKVDSLSHPFDSGFPVATVPYFNDGLHVFEKSNNLDVSDIPNFDVNPFSVPSLATNPSVGRQFLEPTKSDVFSTMNTGHSLNFEDNYYNNVTTNFFDKDANSALYAEIPNEMPFICNEDGEGESSICFNNVIENTHPNFSSQPLQFQEPPNDFSLNEDFRSYSIDHRFMLQPGPQVFDSTPLATLVNLEEGKYANLKSQSFETSGYLNCTPDNPQVQVYAEPVPMFLFEENNVYISSYPETSNSNFHYIKQRRLKVSKRVDKTVHKCSYCPKVFPRPSALKTHINSHTGDQPFKCTYSGCSLSFSVLSNLKRHEKLHPKWELTNKFKIKLNKPDT